MFVNCKHVLLGAAVFATAVISGCGDAKQPESAQPPQASVQKAADTYTGGPVELVIKDENTAIASDEEMQKIITDLVKAKHPDIRLKFVKDKIEALLAEGSPPDLVATSPSALSKYIALEYPGDLTPMIKRLNIDLNKIEPAVIDAIKGYGNNGALYGLPFGMNHGATIYNKDLFERFGVPYPKETMTWEELVELSRKLTREDGGRQYVGVAPAWTIVNAFRQYGASSVDATGEKAALTADGFKYVAELARKFYQIPGIVQNSSPVSNPSNPNANAGQQANTGPTASPTQKAKYTYGNDDFFKEQNLALYTGYIASHLNQLRATKPTFNWDLAAYPVYKDRPNAGNPVDFHMLTVSQASKNKEAAYWVLKTLLSEEAQLAISKAGRISVLKDTQIKQTFAQDSGIFQGKNIASIFKVPNAPLVSSDYSKYKDDIAPFIRSAFEEIALLETDVNTALRKAEEQANQAIRAKNSK